MRCNMMILKINPNTTKSEIRLSGAFTGCQCAEDMRLEITPISANCSGGGVGHCWDRTIAEPCKAARCHPWQQRNPPEPEEPPTFSKITYTVDSFCDGVATVTWDENIRLLSNGLQYAATLYCVGCIAVEFRIIWCGDTILYGQHKPITECSKVYGGNA